MARFFFILLLLLPFNAFSKSSAQVLLLQSVKQGRIVKLHKNNYLLVLEKMPAQVHYFNLGPVKLEGYFSTAQFLKLWQIDNPLYSFINHPPSAVIQLDFSHSIRETVVAYVSNPAFNGHELSYQISILDNKLQNLGKLEGISLYFFDIHWDPRRFLRYLQFAH